MRAYLCAALLVGLASCTLREDPRPQPVEEPDTEFVCISDTLQAP